MTSAAAHHLTRPAHARRAVCALVLGLAVDDGGFVYAGDWINHRIQKFGPIATPSRDDSWGLLKDRYRRSLAARRNTGIRQEKEPGRPPRGRPVHAARSARITCRCP